MYCLLEKEMHASGEWVCILCRVGGRGAGKIWGTVAERDPKPGTGVAFTLGKQKSYDSDVKNPTDRTVTLNLGMQLGI